MLALACNSIKVPNLALLASTENSMIDEHARLLELYEYDVRTGDLIRKVQLSKRGGIGTIAGGNSGGYRFMKIEPGEPSHPVHHVVWFYHKGEWPAKTHDLKFLDGNPRNTRIDNLSLQTKSATVQGAKVRANNKSGIKGINWDSGRHCWQVHLYDANGSRALGRAYTLEDAKAKLEAAKVSNTETRSHTMEQLERRTLLSAQRKVWKLLVAVVGTAHTWVNAELLYTEVGDQPTKKYTLQAKDSSRMVGPGNWEWVAPKNDFKTREGRHAWNLGFRTSRTPEQAEAIFDKAIRKRFDIGVEEYKQKLLEQGGVCATCKQPETATRNGSLRRMAIDHDHITGKVRGLLCNACNTGVGMLKDDPTLLRVMADYIETWRKVHSEPFPDNVVSLKDHKNSALVSFFWLTSSTRLTDSSQGASPTPSTGIISPVEVFPRRLVAGFNLPDN